MIHSFATSDAIRTSVIKSYGLENDYEKMASALGVTPDEAARTDFVNNYWFWLHWGQYCSTTDAEDIEELKRSIGAYEAIPAINYSWEHSFLAKPYLDRRFVDFVEKTLAERAVGHGKAKQNGT